MRNYIKIAFSIAVLGLLLMQSCKGDKDPSENTIVNDVLTPAAQLLSPRNEAELITGNEFQIEIKVNRPDAISKLAVYVNDTLFANDLTVESQTIKIQTNEATKVGPINIYLSYQDENGKMRRDNRNVFFLSEIVPGQKSVTIENTFEHAKTSYTQGLEFYNDKLFEGTGQYGQSILAEVDLKTGNKLREMNLDRALFGEGITILNDTIYQITYRAGKCFMYDMDFNQIGTFFYDGEGWGLCNNGKHILMTNGSNQVVWRDPKTFEIVKSISVADNRVTVGLLNELELINGNLFANIYTDTKVVEIDTTTGKVLNYIDCTALKADANSPGMDVLNGIAFNRATNKTYMTGKWWPKLYEVTFN